MRKLKKLMCLALAAAMSVTLLAGCGGSSGGGDQGGSAAAPAEAKDSLVFAIRTEPTSMDASLGSGDRITYLMTGAIFDRLVVYEDDEFKPGLAESWEISEDGTEYTFKIRQGVKFHHGQDLTAEDVAYSLNERKANDSMNFNAISSIEATDDYTVVMKMEYAFSPILYLLSQPQVGIMNKEEHMADKEGFGRNPNGTGPFKFEQWISGDSVTLSRNDEYWRGPAALKTLTFKIMPQESTQLVALEAGEIDAYFQVSQVNKSIIQDNPDLEWYEVPGTICVSLIFNEGVKPYPNGTEKSIFADNKALREAICYALNKEDINIGATEGSAMVIDTPFPSFVANWPEDFKAQEYNPEKAKEKLAEAGYPNGLDLTLKIRTNTIYVAPAPIIQNQLAQVGINVEILEMESGTYLQEVYNDMDYDMTIYALSADYPDADHAMYRRFYSGNIGGGMNYLQINNPELDELIMKNRTTQDPAVHAECVRRFAEINRDEAYSAPLYAQTQTLAYNKGIKGANMSSIMEINFYKWSW